MTDARQTAGAFTAEQTHGVASKPGNRLVAHSEELGWRSIHAHLTHEAAYEGEAPAVPNFGLVYRLDRPLAVSRDIGHGWEHALIRPRQLTFVPWGTPTSWRVAASAEVAHLYLRRSAVEAIVSEAGGRDPAHLELVPHFAVFDPLLEQIAFNVLRAVRERPPGHALYVDCLAQAMAAHLVQHHSTLTRPPRVPKPDGLTDWRLRRLADHIEAHLGGGLSLDAMAEQAGLSPHYLARAFHRAFGEPPHRYVTRRRVECAKGLLRATDLPVADVALACGFAHQSHFGEAFRRHVGTSPAAYRRGR